MTGTDYFQIMYAEDDWPIPILGGPMRKALSVGSRKMLEERFTEMEVIQAIKECDLTSGSLKHFGIY